MGDCNKCHMNVPSWSHQYRKGTSEDKGRILHTGFSYLDACKKCKLNSGSYFTSKGIQNTVDARLAMLNYDLLPGPTATSRTVPMTRKSVASRRPASSEQIKARMQNEALAIRDQKQAMRAQKTADLKVLVRDVESKVKMFTDSIKQLKNAKQSYSKDTYKRLLNGEKDGLRKYKTMLKQTNKELKKHMKGGKCKCKRKRGGGTKRKCGGAKAKRKKRVVRTRFCAAKTKLGKPCRHRTKTKFCGTHRRKR